MNNISIIAILFILTGCVSYPRPFPDSYEVDGEERKFLATTDVTVVDEQFVPYMGESVKAKYLFSKKVDEPLGSQRPQASIALYKCDLKIGFWENPWSLLSVATLTIYPIGNTYRCKTSLTVKVNDKEEGKTVDSEIEYFNAVGLSTLIVGPANPIILITWKERVIMDAVRKYLKSNKPEASALK